MSDLFRGNTDNKHKKVSDLFIKNIMSNIFLLNEIYIMSKQEKIRDAKGYIVKKSISKTSYPGIYMIK